MRLVSRLSTTFAAVGLTVFGAYSVWLVRSEREDLWAAVNREVGFLATSLRVALENALRDGQDEDALETISKLEQVDATVDLMVLRPDGTPWLEGSDRIGAEEMAFVGSLLGDVVAARAARTVQSTFRDDAELFHLCPLFSDDQAVIGVLVLVRPLSDLQEDLDDTLGLIALTGGLFVLLAAVASWLVGTIYLTHPLAQLLEGIRLLRAGAASTPLVEAGDLEIAALASEFNGMTRDLAAARAALDQEVEARRVAQHALQTADRLLTVGQLSASLAHEIGSPLQVLHGRARALQDRSHDPTQVRASAAIMVSETERVSRIVSQVLAVARRRPPARVEFDLSAVAAQVLTVLEADARRKRIALSASWSAEPVFVRGDPDQIQQVALNLLTNALQATPPAGHVTIATARDGAWARLTVCDDGEGMEEETRERAFEALFTTRAEQGGTGLGLAVVASIVVEHRGRVRCESERHRGSTLTVELPLTAREGGVG